jgi:hypothetical protein
MRRFGTFLFGAVVGAGLLYLASNYHVVQAQDGLHVIEKMNAGLTDPFVDIRAFTLGDWADHQELALAITSAGKQYLLVDAASNSIDRGLEQIQQHLQPRQQKPHLD